MPFEARPLCAFCGEQVETRESSGHPLAAIYQE